MSDTHSSSSSSRSARSVATSQELETATRLGLDFTHIIMRDNAYDIGGFPAGTQIWPRPDVTLVDIDLGAQSGFDVAEQLHRTGWSAPVILISTHAAEDFADSPGGAVSGPQGR